MIEKELAIQLINEASVLGKIAGLNEARLLILGIGYDKDDTAQKMRKQLVDRIYKLKEPIEMSLGIDDWFSGVEKLWDKRIKKRLEEVKENA